MPKRKKLTEVEQLRQSMESDLQKTLRLRIPKPTVFYKIGDRVKYGNWDWSGILAILGNGLFYKVFSVTWHTKQNVPDHSAFKIHYLPWYDMVPHQTQEEIDQSQIFTQDDDVHFHYSQRDLYFLLYLCFEEYGIDLDAEYQRGNVWTLKQKRDLIDSIFKNIDIGKFTVIERPWGDDHNKPITPLLYEALDGKQRITTIRDFFLNRFQYNGKYFCELYPGDKSHFRHYSISYAETKPMTKEQKYRYFLKLNTTGTPQDPSHIKKVWQMWMKEKQSDTHN